MFHVPSFDVDLPVAILDVLPNPVLVKGANLKYVWVNSAFETLFGVNRQEMIGRLDKEMFPDRQVAQCNGGDLRVLETGEVDEAYETVFDQTGGARETLTRKSRLELPDGSTYLVGVMHDLTDVMQTNAELQKSKDLLEEQAKQLVHLADTDTLTGTLTRRALQNAVNAASESSSAHGFLLLDIDHFKQVNDTYGHAAGDAVLVHFCNVVKTAIRPTDVLSRLGGEEFVVYMPDATLDDMRIIGEGIRAKIAKSSFAHEDASIPLTFSAGGAWCTGDAGRAMTTENMLLEVLAGADRRLYQAKMSGRDRIILGEGADLPD